MQPVATALLELHPVLSREGTPCRGRWTGTPARRPPPINGAAERVVCAVALYDGYVAWSSDHTFWGLRSTFVDSGIFCP